MIKHLEVRARLPRLGVIRLGVATRCGRPAGKCRQCWRPNGQEGRGHPREVDYFVVPPELEPVVGKQPKRLDVLLPSNDIHLILPSDYTRYDGGLLTVKCDGERCITIPKTGPEIVGRCEREPYEAGRRRKPCPCGAEASGRLNVIVAKAPLGVYQVLIGGEQRLADLYSSLEMFRGLLGTLVGVPFVIARVAQQAQVRTAEDERLHKTGWPVRLECPAYTANQVLAIRGSLIPKALPAMALPAHLDEQALSPEERGEPEDAGDPGPAEPAEEWDISRCYLAARRIGVEEPVYSRWLLARYHQDADNLDLTNLALEAQALQEAEGDPAAAERRRLMIQRTIGPAAAGKGATR